MKILVWHDKHGRRHFREDAYLAVFHAINEAEYYFNLDGDEQRLFDLASNGDPIAARKLIEGRCEFEYENVTVEEVEDGTAT